jgi:hypothetical protein
MNLKSSLWTLSVLTVLLTTSLAAQTPTPSPPPAKSAKERLSDKGADEQRVDNCRVPPDKRGAAPRPDCPETAQHPLDPSGSPAVEPVPFPSAPRDADR